MNRATIRTALARFEKAEMIIRKSGKGTFLIRATPPQFVRTLNSLEIASLDSVTGKTIFKTIEKHWVEPPENIGLIFNSSSAKVLSFSRVISVDGEPSLLETTYLSDKLSEIFIDLDTNRPYYPLIEKYGKEELSHVKISFTSKKTTPEQRKLLCVDEHHPCIVMQSLLYNKDNEVIEVLNSTYNGEKYSFSLESQVGY